MQQFQKKLEAVKAIVDGSLKDIDMFLLQQHEEELLCYKQEFGKIRKELMGLNVNEHDELITSQSSLSDAIFDTLIRLRILLRQSHNNLNFLHDGEGVKLPKFDVPKFDGNLLKWRTFWEQFKVSIHEQDNLSGAEKLVYLRHSLSEVSAKHVIEGLSCTGECYQDVIECLCSCYDCPRILYQTHVRMIMDTKPPMDGSGKELHQLHDTVQQHL